MLKNKYIKTMSDFYNKNGKLNKAYVFRIYPTKAQMILLDKTFGCVRLSYNTMLDEWNKSYKETGKAIHSTPKQLKEQFPFMKEVDSLAICNAEINLKGAFNKFFHKENGYPKFKKKGIHDSYTTNSQQSKTNGLYSIRIFDKKHILFPKLGLVKTKQHQCIGNDEVIKSATFSKTSNEYFVSILVEYEQNGCNQIQPEQVKLDDCIGFDYSSTHLFVASDGTICDQNKHYRLAQKRLAKLQRKLSKKQRHSKNYVKQQRKLQKLSHHIANQRKDLIEKMSFTFTNQYKVFCFEDLNMRTMSKRKGKLKLGKSTMDNGFGFFRTRCEQKAASKGGCVVKVDKWYPSTKTCNHCGHKLKTIDINTKEWICPDCNKLNQRDYNAALNIKDEGFRLFREYYKLA